MKTVFKVSISAISAIVGSLTVYFSWDLMTSLSLYKVERLVANSDIEINVYDNDTSGLNPSQNTPKKVEFVILADKLGSKEIGRYWKCHVDAIPSDNSNFDSEKSNIQKKLKEELESYFPKKPSSKDHWKWRRGLVDSCSKWKTGDDDEKIIIAKIVMKFEKAESSNWRFIEQDKRKLLSGSLNKTN